MSGVEEKPVVAAWPFQVGFSTDPEFRLQLTDLTRFYLTQTGRFDVLPRDQQDKILKAQKELQDCYDDKCVTQASHLLSVDKLVLGNLARFGNRCVLALQLVDVKKKEQKRITETGGCQEGQISTLVSSAVDQLSSPFSSSRPPVTAGTPLLPPSFYPELQDNIGLQETQVRLAALEHRKSAGLVMGFGGLLLVIVGAVAMFATTQSTGEEVDDFENCVDSNKEICSEPNVDSVRPGTFMGGILMLGGLGLAVGGGIVTPSDEELESARKTVESKSGSTTLSMRF